MADRQDPDAGASVQERWIVNPAEEEVKHKKKVFGLFPRGSGKSGSGTTTPEMRKSVDLPDDDDLPPREAEDDDLPPREPPSGEMDIGADAAGEEEEDKAAIPATAGFDFKAISAQLGKDIDVDKLKQPPDRSVTAESAIAQPREPVERSGSAPPGSQHTEAEFPTRPHLSPLASGVMTRSFTAAVSRTMQEEEDDEGDFAAHAVTQMSLSDVPTWGKPSPPIIPDKPSPPAGFAIQAPSFADAWSSPPISANGFSGFGMPRRAAPPARPHPPEYMANPFAADFKGLSSLKKDEQKVDENPW